MNCFQEDSFPIGEDALSAAEKNQARAVIINAKAVKKVRKKLNSNRFIGLAV